MLVLRQMVNMNKGRGSQLAYHGVYKGLKLPWHLTTKAHPCAWHRSVSEVC